MQRLMVVVTLCLLALAALGQSHIKVSSSHDYRGQAASGSRRQCV